ncbi:S-layer homology domain-containing protein [Paenibacillus guangzhouensis]|uniref:S-layer homology domain-containing protein n=1 Tax=Paenibacillus guangzhouensis TaxID=1473112 RepID=UPI001266C82C|nr:S-layer homology domain-containing protein [Paenibacillus guangzhouensis]
MSKRKMIAFLAAAMVITSVQGSIFAEGENLSTESVQGAETEVKVPNVFTAFKDIANHWGKMEIINAATKGYVNGYEDKTFKPDHSVSRVEFIKMAVTALGLPLEVEANPWYWPYFYAAQKSNVIGDKEYPANGYNDPMTRIEMAKVAVRSAGLTATTDGEYMVLATKNGLIHGTGKGQLDMYETTTRAQSVVIIERILKVRDGEKLPVDEAAIKKAEDFAAAKLDPWGRAIRTTNLPKNAKDFPYILEDIPNEMYEMPYKQIKIFSITTSAQNYLDGFGIARANKASKNIKDYFDHVLNIDYRTIDYKWAEELHKSLSLEGKNQYSINERLRNLKKYVDWVKKYKIVTKGSVQPEPSMVYRQGFNKMRSKFDFTIVSAPKEAFSDWDDHFFEWSIFWNQVLNPPFNSKSVGVRYQGYTNIALTADDRLSGYGEDITYDYKLIK